MKLWKGARRLFYFVNASQKSANRLHNIKRDLGENSATYVKGFEKLLEIQIHPVEK